MMILRLLLQIIRSLRMDW